MSKKRKTKKEKIIADLRRRLTTTQPIPKPLPSNGHIKHTPLLTIQPSTNQSPFFKTSPAKDYTYVKRDMYHTLIVTGAIVGFNLTVFLLLEKNVLHLRLLGW